MLKLERHKRILKYLNDTGTISISDVTKEFNCSEETIRKDLVELENLGKLIRIHGGACIQDIYDKGFPNSLKKTLLKDEKIYMSTLALEYIRENMIISLDSSTTCLELAKKILDSKINVTILTNSLDIANICSFSNKIKIFLAGGMLKNSSNSFIGHTVIDFLNYFVSDISFVSFPCMDIDFGFGDNTMEGLKIRSTLLNRSKLKILLLDHTKLEDNNATVFTKKLKIDTIITDKKINKKWNEFFKKEGIDVKF